MSQWIYQNGEWFLPLIVGVSVFVLVVVAAWPRDLMERAAKGIRVDG